MILSRSVCLMKLNPFKVNYFNNLFIFHEKNESIVLKIYIFTDFSKLKESIEIIEKELKDFKNLSFCIQIHYEYPKKAYYLSLNCKLDGFFLKIHDFEKKFQEIDCKVADNCVNLNDPYDNVYLTLFSGIESFLMKIAKNQIILLDPMTKKNLLNIALFQIKLSNLEVVSNFFNFFVDLSLKMKLKFEIYFFIKKENDKMLIKSIIAFIDKNRHRFFDMLDKFSNIKELRIMLEAIQINKKRITELFIRRLIDEQFDFKIDGHLDFLSKYISDQQQPDEQDKHKIINLAPISTETTRSTVDFSIESPSTGTIDDSSRNLFHEYIQGSNIHGNFVDSQEYVFDDGTIIYFLINKLNINALLKIIKDFIINRKFTLIFIEPEELIEFSQKIPLNINAILKTYNLSEFKFDLQFQSLSS